MSSREDVERRELYPRDGYLVDMALGNRTAISNDHAKRWVERVRMHETDSSREKRAEAQQCRSCYYLLGAGLSFGYQHVNCRQCDGRMLVDSGTDMDVCAECAERYHICRRCGGDIEGNERRRKMERRGVK